MLDYEYMHKKTVGNVTVVKEKSGSSMSLCMALFLIFLVLKLCHVIDWSWLWVTCPLWIIPAIAIGLIAAVIAGAVIFFVIVGSIWCIAALWCAIRDNK